MYCMCICTIAGMKKKNSLAAKIATSQSFRKDFNLHCMEKHIYLVVENTVITPINIEDAVLVLFASFLCSMCTSPRVH